ncbi:MAG: hypothetical protein ABI785_11000 [Gemmatimonadales bacterium]
MQIVFPAGRTGRRVLALAVLSAVMVAEPAAAQWSQVADQFYLPASHNWAFRHGYPGADRLFNAFDYGHAILYEKLYTKPNAPVSELEDKEYNFITRELLVHPPRVPLEEGAIEVAYAKLVPEARAMFDWAHLLHRQIYDVWADERIPPAGKDARVAELVRYYKTRKDLAFSSLPKTMELMEGQPYSLAFRQKYPKFNGLIWAYHWLQVGLYEPLVTGTSVDERQTGVTAAVARFRQMLTNPPRSMPYIMPMTAAVAPTFAARYPEAAIIFDNLHSMHDVVSDILASPQVPKKQKRAEILKAAARYRDATSFVMTPDEWRQMAQMMGVNNMGGPAVGFLAMLPTPSVALGASMVGMGPGAMGGKMEDMPGMDHGKMSGTADTMSGMAQAGTAGMKDSMAAMRPGAMSGQMGDQHMRQMMQMHQRMMADPIIRKRMMADTTMRRMMSEMMQQVPAEHRDSMKQMMRPLKPPVPKPATKKQPMDSMPGMDHGQMPGMEKR